MGIGRAEGRAVGSPRSPLLRVSQVVVLFLFPLGSLQSLTEMEEEKELD